MLKMKNGVIADPTAMLQIKGAAQFLQIVLHMVTLDSFALAMMGRASTGLLRVPVQRVKGRIPSVGRRW
jgi:hypothetical protein